MKIEVPYKPEFSDVLEARGFVEEVERAYLKSKGWRVSSNNPSCLWLWEKGEFKGVAKKTAISIESRTP